MTIENDAHIVEHDGDIIVPDSPDIPFDQPASVAGEDYWDQVADEYYRAHPDEARASRPDKNSPSVDSEEVVDEPSKRKVRQGLLLKQQGFLATSPGELVRAIGLTRPDMQSLGGAAKYIGIVVQRQHNLDSKPDDPAAAGRAVTNEMIEFAKKARGDRAALKMLGDILDSSDLLPTTRVTEVSSLKDWQYEGLLRRAFLDLQRLTETVEFIEGNGEDHLDDVYNSSDEDMVKKLEKFVDSLSISEAKDLVHQSDEQRKIQLKFWVDRLNEIERRSMDPRLKAMTRQALVNLGVTRPE